MCRWVWRGKKNLWKMLCNPCGSITENCIDHVLEKLTTVSTVYIAIVFQVHKEKCIISKIRDVWTTTCQHLCLNRAYLTYSAHAIQTSDDQYCEQFDSILYERYLTVLCWFIFCWFLLDLNLCLYLFFCVYTCFLYKCFYFVAFM